MLVNALLSAINKGWAAKCKLRVAQECSTLDVAVRELRELHFSLLTMRLLGIGTLLLILRPLYLRPAAVLLFALVVRLPRSALSAQSGRAQGASAGSVAALAVVAASAAAGAAL